MRSLIGFLAIVAVASLCLAQPAYSFCPGGGDGDVCPGGGDGDVCPGDGGDDD